MPTKCTSLSLRSSLSILVARPRHLFSAASTAAFIDSAKVLDSFSGNGPKDAPESERVFIRIDLGADLRAKGLESNPADVIEFEASVRPNPDPNNTNIIDHQTPMIEANQQEAIPPKRGPGRPPGSKNKPKTTKPDDVTPPLPGFAV